MRRLTALQVERTVSDVFGVQVDLNVADERLLTFRSNISASIDTASARGYLDFASAVVAATDWQRCESGCLDWLLDEVGLLLFRRPLDDAERTRYSALYELALDNTDDPQEAAGWVAEAMLQSPTFLYLDEVATEAGVLDDYSLAARLALLLWGRNPDSSLLAQAEAGELSTPEQLAATVELMLADARTETGIRDFVDQWFDLERLDDPEVRPDVADLGSATIRALREEPVQYFLRLLRSEAGVERLLTDSTTVASTELEELYGADIVDSDADVFELDPERRGGILSLPGVVAALSHAHRTSPTLRGKTVLTGLLCTPPQPPPANIDTTLPEVDEGVSTRERIEQHMESPVCGNCHRGMDGIGLALEKLDWLGRYREEENGVAIDDTSTFPLGSEEVTVQGAAELGAVLGASSSVAACVSRQWLRYALGVTETAAVDCLVEDLASEATGVRGLERMMVKALASDWFRLSPEAAP